MRALMKLERVSMRFGGLCALDDITLEIGAGEVLGLIGPNGAGKSTLLNLLAGVFAPTAGRVSLDGDDITRVPAHERCRRGVIKTSQLTRPFAHLTVEENVAIGAFLRHRRPEDALARARHWLDWLGLSPGAHRTAGSLSTADRKRLEVARALATEPRLLLLDEVFSGLNAAEIEEGLAWARRVADLGVTIVLTEHLLRPITALAQRTVVLDQGRMICDALTHAALADPRVLEAYFGSKEHAHA